MSDSSSLPIPDRYTLVFRTPPENLPTIKTALFATGAGTYPGGKYTHVCFETPGRGQFLPEAAAGAKPAVGKVGELEHVEELQMQMICVGRDVMLAAVEALKRTHPYEVVGYEVYKMEPV